MTGSRDALEQLGAVLADPGRNPPAVRRASEPSRPDDEGPGTSRVT